MRHYVLFVLLLFTTVFSKAQSQEKNVYNNTNTNTGNTLIIQDTTIQAPAQEEMRIESKKVKSYKASSAPKLADEKADKDSNSSIQQLKSAKYQFETNYSNSKHQLTRRSASPLELQNMKQSAQLYANMLPGSFEKHFYTYLLSKYDPKQFHELKQAAKLEPTKTEVQQELVAYGIAVNDQKLSDSVTVQMIAQNKITGG